MVSMDCQVSRGCRSDHCFHDGTQLSTWNCLSGSFKASCSEAEDVQVDRVADDPAGIGYHLEHDLSEFLMLVSSSNRAHAVVKVTSCDHAYLDCTLRDPSAP